MYIFHHHHVFVELCNKLSRTLNLPQYMTNMVLVSLCDCVEYRAGSVRALHEAVLEEI
jgi:hypothetical protein